MTTHQLAKPVKERTDFKHIKISRFPACRDAGAANPLELYNGHDRLMVIFVADMSLAPATVGPAIIPGFFDRIRVVVARMNQGC